MSTRTPRDYDGSAPLICWPLYWSVMAAKRTETGPSWWLLNYHRLRRQHAYEQQEAARKAREAKPKTAKPKKAKAPKVKLAKAA